MSEGCVDYRGGFPVSLAYKFPTLTGCQSIPGELLDAAGMIRVKGGCGERVEQGSSATPAGGSWSLDVIIFAQ